MHRPLINDPRDFLAEALEGFVRTYPALVRWDREANIVTRATPSGPKVGLMSGGGSGHEPLHVGFVGTGMLDVAVPGAVFSSPTAAQVVAGVHAADTGRGVVQVVKNYTGDVLNFSIAAEMAAARGIAVERVLVDDDLATEHVAEGGPGRRGTAAVVIVEKICGAAAEAGADLAHVAALGRRVAGSSRTLSLALSSGTHPGAARASFDLADDEVELGVGIHGERGTGRIPYAPVDLLVDQLVEPLLAHLEPAAGSAVFVVVNGLGTAYPLELNVVARRVFQLLDAKGVTVARSLVGSYVTSLDMKGVSVTLSIAEPDLVDLWDAAVRTPALSW